MGLRRRALGILLASRRLRWPGAKSEPLALPLRVRPAFIALTAIVMVLLALLGFHPTLASRTRINDKILHFVCFGVATGTFVWIWDIDDAARRQFIWRHATAILTGLTCFGVGAIGSEFVQSLVPGKSFQWGDIVANLLGASLGLYIAHRLERQHRRNRELAALYKPLNPEDAYPSDGEDQLAQGSQMFGGTNDVWSGRDSMSEVFALEDADDPSPTGRPG